VDKVLNLCKNRGFVFAGSEIYGGLANTWDYGPLGIELKNNIKSLWWRHFVTQGENSVGMDGGILMNPQVWVASGHVGGFSDPLMDCKACKTRHRADKLIEDHSKGGVNADFKPNEWLEKWIGDNGVKCPGCGKIDWTNIRQFNLMFKTTRGTIEKALQGKNPTGDTTPLQKDFSDGTVFLRPETAQNQFVNFLNVQRSMRLKLPFGIGQIGKAFRNEITPGNFIFRTVEFEQMEHQLFCREPQAATFYNSYKDIAWKFYTDVLGLDPKKLRFKDHEHLCHYAKMACDMEFDFPFGWGEIAGTHHRGTFDLGNHNLQYVDPVTNEKFTPTVIESSHGADRILLAAICNAYCEEPVTGDSKDGDVRVVLKFHPRLAPYKAAVLPLQRKEQGEQATAIYRELSKHFSCTFDDTASIGKRYRRQDEIGTPFCITVDFDTATDGKVTVRERDSMKQKRVPLKSLPKYISSRII